MAFFRFPDIFSSEERVRRASLLVVLVWIYLLVSVLFLLFVSLAERTVLLKAVTAFCHFGVRRYLPCDKSSRLDGDSELVVRS